MYAVRQYEEGGWVLVRLVKTSKEAFQIKKDIHGNLRRPYPLVEPKVVKATQQIIDAWVIAGNKLPV